MALAIAGSLLVAVSIQPVGSALLVHLLDPGTLAALADPASILHLLAKFGGAALLGLGALQIWSDLRRARPSAPVTPHVPLAPSDRAVVRPISLVTTEDGAEAERAGDYRRAAELYDRRFNPGGASRCYGLAARAASAGSLEQGALVDLCLQRARQAGTVQVAIDLLADLGEFRRAAEIAKAHGDATASAALLQRAGDHTGAAAALQGAGDLRGAARALAAAGNTAGAIEMLAAKDPAGAAALAAEQGEILRAVELYAMAGEPAEAATLLSIHGDLRRAARLYRQAGDHAAAAGCHERAGDVAEAAAVLLDGGQPRRAAELFRKMGDRAGLALALEQQGDLAGAARLHLELGKVEEAVRVLRARPLSDGSSPEVCVLEAACLVQLGQIDRAVDLLQPVVAADGLDPQLVCEAFYLLGDAYEKKGEVPQAEAAFRQTVALVPHYRDVSVRLARLGPKTLPPDAPAADAGEATARPTGDGSDPTAVARARPRGGSIGGVPLPARYRVSSLIGRGAMGVVYKCFDDVLDRFVAIKALDSSLAQQDAMRLYFAREARVMAALNHPHIVTVFDAGIEGATPYLVMEYLEGTDLKALLARRQISERAALTSCAQVASALSAVHGRQIVHRDVKPANIFLLASGRVKLMDFGVAHVDRGHATSVVGTPIFMAPEQILGQPLGPWTDIYALGATLYTLLTGQPCFPDGEPLFHAVHTPAPDLRELRPEVQPGVAALVKSCLAKEPGARPQNAADLATALEEMAKATRA